MEDQENVRPVKCFFFFILYYHKPFDLILKQLHLLENKVFLFANVKRYGNVFVVRKQQVLNRQPTIILGVSYVTHKFLTF